MTDVNQVSVLQQMYLDQSRSTDAQYNDNKKKYCKRNHRFCLIWMLIGILIGSIPLAVITVLYMKQHNYKAVGSPPLALLRWNTTAITVAGTSAAAGNGSTQLNHPYDIVVDYSYTLYIVDSLNHRVQKYLRDSLTGTTIAGQTGGTSGSGPTQFIKPSAVLVNTNGDIFVADSGNHRIQFWKNGASSASTIAGTGSSGSANNRLRFPIDIQQNSNTGTLYIADYGNNRMMSYESGASSGTVVAGGNGPGLNQTQLNSPTSLYFDSLSNSLVISNFASHNVIRWTIGATNWTLLAGSISGTAGSTSTSFNLPRYVTFDPMGNMYVADTDNHRIQFFSAGQSTGITILGISGISGTNATLFKKPFSVKLDSQLNLYVADHYNHRIQKFVRY